MMVVAMWRRVAESGPAPRINTADPYLLAFLRGGENEVARVALISLIDRGVLKASDTSVQVAKHVNQDQVRHPIEKLLVTHFANSDEAASIFKLSSDLKGACAGYERVLEVNDLLPNQSTQS